MKTLKIRGLKGTSDKINANPFEKRIEILGSNFRTQDLEKLSKWVDEYLQKERTITLKFLDDPNRPIVHGFSTRHLDYVNFPRKKSKWNEKVEDSFKAQPSQLRSILSKFKEFSFIIEEDDDHPELIANYQTGNVEINGRIFSENTYFYFLPLLAWIDNYLEDKSHKIVLKTKLEYIGDESKEIIFDIFEMIKNKSETSEFIWYYPDDALQTKEEGYEYREACKLGDRMKLASYHIE